MARPSVTVLLLLLAVAHCRNLEADPATDASTAESTAVVAVGDETGPPNPTFPAESGATEVVPAEQHGFLRLPSHRRPCGHGLFHRHHWWARHHGVFLDGHHRHRGEAELARDGEPSREASELDEVKAVAEPDPDLSLPESDGGGEVDRRPFRHGEDGGDDDAAVVKHWRKEMLWRMFRHGLRHHLHHHHHHHHEQEEQGRAAVKRFRHHDNEEDADEEKEKKTRKLFHHHEDEEEDRKPFHHADADESDSDSDDEDEELEEMVRRFRRAIMRRRFGHGRFFRHHHADGEQQQEEGSGVMTWIKGLMNRF